MKRVISRITITLVLLLVVVMAFVGCTTSISVYGNLASSASIAFQSGTQSDAISLIDGRGDTKWKGDASGDEPIIVVINFPMKVKFNKIVFDEDGERVSGYKIQIPSGNGVDNWRSIYEGTYFNKDGICTFETVSSNQIRLLIDDSDGKFAIREIGIYYEELGETQHRQD